MGSIYTLHKDARRWFVLVTCHVFIVRREPDHLEATELEAPELYLGAYI